MPKFCKRHMLSSFAYSCCNRHSPLSTSCLPLFSNIFCSVPLGDKMYLSLRIAHWESIETWTNVFNKHNFLTQCATTYMQLIICDNTTYAFYFYSIYNWSKCILHAKHTGKNREIVTFTAEIQFFKQYDYIYEIIIVNK